MAAADGAMDLALPSEPGQDRSRLGPNLSQPSVARSLLALRALVAQGIQSGLLNQ